MLMRNFGTKIRKLPWRHICPILTIVLFFSFCVILTYDSGHYLSYVSIFEGNLPGSSWDIVRGPVFPLIIHIFNILFGKTNTGLLIGLFLFYIVFAITCYKTCQEICQYYKHRKLIQNIVVIILIFNPLIFGYFHVLLTEFVAITLTMLNLFIAYRWIFIDNKRKRSLFLYATYFVLSIAFCYHLKQPYIIISFIPPFIAAVISIVRDHHKKNIIYRSLTIVIALLFLLISIFSWNTILRKIGANENTGRDSSSMLGQQLLLAYQIPYDNDGDGKNDRLSTGDAIALIMHEFSQHPLRIVKIYFQNYCGLSSMCEITTPNGYDFYSTSNPVGLSTYENTFIGYATYRTEGNISSMREEMTARASAYISPANKSIFSNIMKNLIIPSNILFKISAVIPLPSIIVLLILKQKNKTKTYNRLFYLNILLLLTSFAHLSISAGIGLIIDRYAIETFVPSLLGLFGTITYAIVLAKHHHGTIHTKSQTKKKTNKSSTSKEGSIKKIISSSSQLNTAHHH